MYDRDYIIKKIQYWEAQLEKAHRVPTNWYNQTPVQRFYKSYYGNRRSIRRNNGY